MLQDGYTGQNDTLVLVELFQHKQGSMTVKYRVLCTSMHQMKPNFFFFEIAKVIKQQKKQFGNNGYFLGCSVVLRF